MSSNKTVTHGQIPAGRPAAEPDPQAQGRFYEPEILSRLQQEILSILDDFLLICETYHLEYFGIAGTGIGAIRHKGFIPWDDDIDIAMPRKDFEKFLKIVQKKMGCGKFIICSINIPVDPCHIQFSHLD